MSNLNEICEWFENNLMGADPWAVILKLGAFNFVDTSDEQEKLRLESTKQYFQATYKAEQYTALWEAIERYLKQESFIVPEALQLVESAQFYLLSIPNGFDTISNEQIISMGLNYPLYRSALIALIRKNNNSSDPFNEFNFAILKETGAEQTSSYLGEFIKKCSALPIAAVFKLGQRTEIAELILKDCFSHEQYFELSGEFAKKHPALRTIIAGAWKAYFQNYPLTNNQIAYLDAVMPQIKIFPEFASLQIESRLPRALERAKPEGEPFSSMLNYMKGLLEQNLTVSQEYIDLMHRAKTTIVGYSHNITLKVKDALCLTTKTGRPKFN